jgi:hypothetical protein
MSLGKEYRQNRSLHEHCGDIIAAVRSGAAVDATLAGATPKAPAGTTTACGG